MLNVATRSVAAFAGFVTGPVAGTIPRADSPEAGGVGVVTDTHPSATIPVNPSASHPATSQCAIRLGVCLLITEKG